MADDTVTDRQGLNRSFTSADAGGESLTKLVCRDLVNFRLEWL
jgi:hypothetical protein